MSFYQIKSLVHGATTKAILTIRGKFTRVAGVVPTKHKFKVGDFVVYTNDFGVCWGVKVISELDTRNYDLWGDPHTVMTYHYVGTDTPWFSVNECHFVMATDEDLMNNGNDNYFQNKYGFKPVDYFGCY